jgi:hypothetical protein
MYGAASCGGEPAVLPAYDVLGQLTENPQAGRETSSPSRLTASHFLSLPPRRREGKSQRADPFL